MTISVPMLAPRRRGTIALLIGVVIIAVLLLLSAYDPAGLHQAIITLRKLQLSKEATGNLKDTLTSAAGAILASTAIGISLATFFIQQNVEHIPYRAVLLISRQDRIIAYLTATVALAIGAYILAAIITPRNALAVAIAGIAIVLVFTYVIAKFFLDNMRLLDPVTAITVISRDRRERLHQRRQAFDTILHGIRAETAGRSERDIVVIGHAHETDVINVTNDLRDIADGFVEEVIPQIRVLARQGDYRAAQAGCKEIGDVCFAAVTATEDIFTHYRQVALIRFTNRPNFLNTFGRLLALAEQAREARDPNLYAVIINAHLAMSRELMPLANAAGVRGNTDSMLHAFLQFSRFAATSYSVDLVDIPNSCINAIADLVDAWEAEFDIFPYLLRSEVQEIVRNSLPLHSGDLAVDRGLKCLIAFLRRAMQLGAQQLSQVSQTLDTMSALIKLFADKYALANGAQLEFRSALEPVVADYTVAAPAVSLFAIVHNAIPPWRPYVANDTFDDLAVWLPFTKGCLDVWRSAGAMLAQTSAAQEYTSPIAERILDTIRACIELRAALPAGRAEINALDQLVDHELGAFPSVVARFAFDKVFRFIVWNALADIAVAAASAGRPGVSRIVVRVCLDLAELCMAPDTSIRPDDTGAFIYIAIILSALDDTDASVNFAVDRLRAKLWAALIERDPRAPATFTALLQRADAQSFTADQPETYLYTIHSRAKLVGQAGMPRIAAVQQQVLAALQSIGQ